MSNIQFGHTKHDNSYKGMCPIGSIALQPISKEDFYTSFKEQCTDILLNLGISLCSDEDNFCRKTGREVAISKMKPTMCAIRNVEVRHGNGKHRYIWHLETVISNPKRRKKKIRVQFGISTVHTSKESQLVYVEYYFV